MEGADLLSYDQQVFDVEELSVEGALLGAYKFLSQLEGLDAQTQGLL